MIRREERAQIAALTAMFLLLVLVIAVPISVFATTRGRQHRLEFAVEQPSGALHYELPRSSTALHGGR